MSFIQSRLPYGIIFIWACIIFFFTLWDIFYQKEWQQELLAVYGILLILAVVLIFLRSVHKIDETASEEEQMVYYQCPSCQEIFSISKSQRDAEEFFTLTCPDCGKTGKISTTPK